MNPWTSSQGRPAVPYEKNQGFSHHAGESNKSPLRVALFLPNYLQLVRRSGESVLGLLPRAVGH